MDTEARTYMCIYIYCVTRCLLKIRFDLSFPDIAFLLDCTKWLLQSGHHGLHRESWSHSPPAANSRRPS